MQAGIDFADYFAEDLFEVRRGGSNQGLTDAPKTQKTVVFLSGNPWDPESLLTGAEVAAGYTYGNSKRDWKSQQEYFEAISGLWTVEKTLERAPRRFVPLRYDIDLLPKVS